MSDLREKIERWAAQPTYTFQDRAMNEANVYGAEQMLDLLWPVIESGVRVHTLGEVMNLNYSPAAAMHLQGAHIELGRALAALEGRLGE